MTPGPQNPHCRAPLSSIVFWSGCSWSFVARPSIVSTWHPSAWPASIKQAFTVCPSTMTVQAPQSPTSQPSLAPGSWKLSRNNLSRVVSGGTEAVRLSPLTVMVTSSMDWRLLHRPRMGALQRAFHEHGNQVAPVSGARAEIADGLGFHRRQTARLFHRLGGDRAAFEIGFGLDGPDDGRSDRAERDPSLPEAVLVPIDPKTRRRIDQRQGLSLAQAEFLEGGRFADKPLRDDDLDQQLIGSERGLARADEQFLKRNLAASAGACHGDARVERQQHGAAVHGRDAGHQVAAQRGEISGLH